jgi:hypothetical protein
MRSTMNEPSIVPQPKRRESILGYLRRNILWEGFDSFWWETSRGRPPLVVLAAVWLLTPILVFVTFVVTALVVGILLYRPCLWLGLIRRDFSFYPSDNVLVSVSYLTGFFASWLAVRPTISTTVLYCILDDEEDFKQNENAASTIDRHTELCDHWQCGTTTKEADEDV